MEAEPTVCPICGVTLTEQDTIPCGNEQCAVGAANLAAKPMMNADIKVGLPK
jgi:hypothetical protein